jgi:hypothetical protein
MEMFMIMLKDLLINTLESIKKKKEVNEYTINNMLILAEKYMSALNFIEFKKELEDMK